MQQHWTDTFHKRISVFFYFLRCISFSRKWQVNDMENKAEHVYLYHIYFTLLSRPTWIECFLFCCCAIFFATRRIISQTVERILVKTISEVGSYKLGLVQKNWRRHFAYPSRNFTGSQQVRNLTSIFHLSRIWVSRILKCSNLKSKIKFQVPMTGPCPPQSWYSVQFTQLWCPSEWMVSWKTGEGNLLNHQ